MTNVTELIPAQTKLRLKFCEKDIRDNTTRLKKVSGIYILYDALEIALYIGQSKDLERRLKQQLKQPSPHVSWWLDKIESIECFLMPSLGRQEREYIEASLINELKPILNRDKARYKSNYRLIRNSFEMHKQEIQIYEQRRREILSRR